MEDLRLVPVQTEHSRNAGSTPADTSAHTTASRAARLRSAPVRLALIYVIASGLWIIASSELVFFEISEPAAITRWEVAKGLIFITASGALIYWITHRLVTRLLKSGKSLQNSEAQVKLLEDQLIQNQKFEALGRLTRGIAHDFNNVINIIAARTHLLGIEIGSGPGQAHVQAIRHASERATALTRQLVAFSRRQTLHPAPLNLNTVVQRTSAILETLLDPQIELRLNLGSHLWDITADADQMTQVVMNLCLNARDAMPQGGTIEIQTRNISSGDETAARLPQHIPGSTVLLAVTDSGSGIPPGVREHIFEPFFTTKHPTAGTGLGLSIVSEIVKRNNGFIDVKSQPGEGSTFYLYLPRSGANSNVRSEANIGACG